MSTPEVKPSAKLEEAVSSWTKHFERRAPSASPESLQAVIDSIRLFLRHWRSALVALLVLLCCLAWAGWEEVPNDRWRIGFLSGAAVFNTFFQAGVCLVLERHAGMPNQRFWRAHWFLVWSITLNAILWAFVPLIASELSAHALQLSCIFNSMILFSVASSPGSPAMLLAAGIPLFSVDSIVLTGAGQPAFAACYAALMVLIMVYGLRLQRATRKAARH